MIMLWDLCIVFWPSPTVVFRHVVIRRQLHFLSNATILFFMFIVLFPKILPQSKIDKYVMHRFGRTNLGFHFRFGGSKGQEGLMNDWIFSTKEDWYVFGVNGILLPFNCIWQVLAMRRKLPHIHRTMVYCIGYQQCNRRRPGS